MIKNRTTKRNAKTKQIARDLVADELPQIDDQLAVGKTLRFVTTGGAGASASSTVTFANLLDAWLVAGTATNGYQLFDFVKVRRVIVRAVPSANNQISVTVGIEYPGLTAGGNASGKQAVATSLGSAKPAIVHLKPGPDAAAGFWQPSSNDVAFVVRATNSDTTICTGAIIDVELSFKNNADVNPAAVSSAIAGATAGNLYYGGIDGGRLGATWARSAFVPRI